MAIKRFALCSFLIITAWAYLYTQDNPKVSTDLLASVLKKIGMDVSTSNISPEIAQKLEKFDSSSKTDLQDMVDRKTEAFNNSYEKISSSKDSMFDSIEQIKAAAQLFQQSKNQMLNEFKDLPTDLLKADSFEIIQPSPKDEIKIVAPSE